MRSSSVANRRHKVWWEAHLNMKIAKKALACVLALFLAGFAHLERASASIGELVWSGEIIGSIGDSGNAAGKPAHMHYSVLSLIPRPWEIDGATQGWKKAFYVNPIDYLTGDDGPFDRAP